MSRARLKTSFVAAVLAASAAANAGTIKVDPGRLYSKGSVRFLTVLHNVTSLTTPSVLKDGIAEVVFFPSPEAASLRMIFPDLRRKLTFDCRVANVRAFEVIAVDSRNGGVTPIQSAVSSKADGLHLEFVVPKPATKSNLLDVQIAPLDRNSFWTFSDCVIRY